MKFATKVIHAGVEPEPQTGAVMTPIFQTSTYAQSAPNVNKGYDYGRVRNPTRTVLENSLASLENANFAACFGSGIAAIDGVLKLLKPGDKILASQDLYGGTYRLLTRIYATYGIGVQFLNFQEDVKSFMTETVKMVWFETPSNPLIQIIDIAALAALKAEYNFYLVVDNTFATPFAQRPLDLGVDIIVHSVTKYLGGHSDLLLGAAITNDKTVQEHLAFIQKSCGAIPGPQDCFLALRGLKTLQVRMERHCENGLAVAKYLDSHPEIGQVYYPGLPTHTYHEIAAKQMNNRFGGMLSFTFKNDSMGVAVKFLSALKVFMLAESLGGVESLANHPATMTHGSVPRERRLKIGLVDSLIRLSIGIEAVEDLTEDLEQAIKVALE